MTMDSLFFNTLFVVAAVLIIAAIIGIAVMESAKGLDEDEDECKK